MIDFALRTRSAPFRGIDDIEFGKREPRKAPRDHFPPVLSVRINVEILEYVVPPGVDDFVYPSRMIISGKGRDDDGPVQPLPQLLSVTGHYAVPDRKGITIETVAPQKAAHASISLRRFSSASDRRYAASVSLPIACASAASATSRGKVVLSPAPVAK